MRWFAVSRIRHLFCICFQKVESPRLNRYERKYEGTIFQPSAVSAVHSRAKAWWGWFLKRVQDASAKGSSKEVKRIGIASLKTIRESQSHKRLRRINEGTHAPIGHGRKRHESGFVAVGSDAKNPVNINRPLTQRVKRHEVPTRPIQNVEWFLFTTCSRNDALDAEFACSCSFDGTVASKTRRCRNLINT